MGDISPLSVILVKNGSKGDKLLFRYPYDIDGVGEVQPKGKRPNPYALPVIEDLHSNRTPAPSNIGNGHLVGFPDKVLSNLFAVKTQLCDKKFELKVNDVRFVGHPVLLQSSSTRHHNSTIILVNIVFALRANASHAVVDCYHDLSKRLGIAIRHEEHRCGYLSNEAKIMLSVHDEEAANSEDKCHSPFQLILSQSQLAQDLKKTYESLCSTGIVHLYINHWVEVSFCLPQKVHTRHNKDMVVEPHALNKCLASLRPYHAMLLLVDENELLEAFSPDTSPSLVRLVRIASPLKSLQQLAADADLAMSHVFCVVGHLVYWAKALVIYPLCESNVYVLAPHATTHISSPLVESFAKRFVGASLLAVLSEFSLPISLSQKGNPTNLHHQQVQQVQMVVWMLQHLLLMQLHTYVYLVPPPHGGGNATSSRRLQTQRPFSEEGSRNGKGACDSDAASDDSMPSTSSIVAHSQGSVLSDDLFPRKHLQSCLPNDLDPSEKESIVMVPAASNPEDLLLFARLCPYFRGNHHLEEIMYYENVRRSQLLALLDKFRSVIITCQHEDPAVAMFYRRRSD